MNNDISDVNKYTNTPSKRINKVRPEVSVSSASEEIQDLKTMTNSMDYLGAMGFAQVKMGNVLSKNVKKSVDSFLEDTEYAKEHVELCDELVKCGYPLEKAIDTTDKIFDSLSSKDTYK